MNTKKLMKTKRRLRRERLEEHALYVEAAMDDGAITHKAIAKLAGITIIDLNVLFKENKLLQAKYKNRRRGIVGTAVDNYYNWVGDITSPNCYAASKYMLEHFKSEFDENLDVKTGDGLDVEIGSESNAPVVIRFGKSKPSVNKD